MMILFPPEPGPSPIRKCNGCNAPDQHPEKSKIDHDDVLDLCGKLDECKTYDDVLQLVTGVKYEVPKKVKNDYVVDARRYAAMLQDQQIFKAPQKPSWVERMRIRLRRSLFGF